VITKNLHQDRDLGKLKEVYEKLKTLDPIPVEPDCPSIEYRISLEWIEEFKNWNCMSKELDDPYSVYILYYTHWRAVLSHYVLDETLKNSQKKKLFPIPCIQLLKKVIH
jgi:hypothetical protein